MICLYFRMGRELLESLESIFWQIFLPPPSSSTTFHLCHGLYRFIELKVLIIHGVDKFIELKVLYKSWSMQVYSAQGFDCHRVLGLSELKVQISPRVYKLLEL